MRPSARFPKRLLAIIADCTSDVSPGSSAARRRPAAAIGLLLAFLVIGVSGTASGGVAVWLSKRSPLKLAGLLPFSSTMTDHWYWSGAWLYPVGDPYTLGRENDGTPGFRVNRGLEWRDNGALSHQGVDLCNRRAGGIVRAAAHGLVVSADTAASGGYGEHAVLAHRLDDGRLVYSVYAHLAPGSIRVEEGEVVHAGQLLGRVGRSGRASTDHLHFEVRIASDPGERWEKARVVDPMAFVRAHLLHGSPDTSWAAPYLEWAACSALIPYDRGGNGALSRDTWWRMIAHAARHGVEEVPEDGSRLRASLIEAGLLVASETPDSVVTWRELAGDLGRLRKVGVRLPPCAVDPTARRAACIERFASPNPAEHLKQLSRLREPSLTVADACLALADMSSPELP